MADIEWLNQYYDKNEKEILQDFFKFLQFQSISSMPEYKSETIACAKWLNEYLKDLKFETEIWETSGHPVIFASNLKAGKNQPTLLIYHHYDVQPIDPLELWDSKPFNPEIRNGQIYARGAQDNKGQCFYTLQALKALLDKDGSFPINIKLCIEGEEECGSHGLTGLLKIKSEELKADFLSVVDLGIQSLKKPSITLGIRGIVTMDLEVLGSKTDMHSGCNGGLLYNPNHALVEILSSLRDKDGRIQVPGFYEGVADLGELEKKTLSLDFDEKEYFENFGALASGGEKKYHPLIRNWVRPTLEINGISGGFRGLGFKTVIPARAEAKISCRLVPNQDPEIIGLSVKKFIEKQAPEGVLVKVTLHEGGGKAMHSSPDSKIVQVFKESYEQVFKKPCDFVYEGASIPVVTELAIASKAEVALIGLGLATDCIHAPNEHFGLDRFKMGFLIMANAISNLKS